MPCAKDKQAESVAELYSQTVSLLTPRIVVHGRPQYLQADRTVNWIRTLLFSALRSAVLWDQLGGGRWSLMFGRQKMLKEAEELLPGLSNNWIHGLGFKHAINDNCGV